ncbi:MAG: glycosyltransferase [Ruminococcaceae bacterium]|nr:glycosyltransferase [Oscillospiraceae bacterium]
MEIIDLICSFTASLIGLCCAYQIIYALIGLFCKGRKFDEAKKKRKFGIVISARNEEKVIGNLLESIEKQEYPKGSVRVFLVADNCTDNTAKIGRDHSATVYERNDPQKARKGWALEFLFDRINEDFGIETHDVYVIFDADNILDPLFLSKINDALDSGADVAVGYRDIKNFDTNPISAAYGIHFYRSTATLHRPRAVLGLSTHIAGTGYAIKSEHLKDGWHFSSLTEDTQFTLNAIADGKKIVFCEDAIFYDEQPYQLKVMIRQRLRWAKGRLFSFLSCARKLFFGIFRKGSRKFECYDMFFYAFPKALFSAILSLIYPITTLILGTFSVQTDLFSVISKLLGTLLSSYFGFLLIGAISVFRERDKIHCPAGKMLIYILTFPLFDLTGLPIAIASLFMRIKWKPIKHDKAIKIEDIHKQENKNAKN